MYISLPTSVGAADHTTPIHLVIAHAGTERNDLALHKMRTSNAISRSNPGSPHSGTANMDALHAQPTRS